MEASIYKVAHLTNKKKIKTLYVFLGNLLNPQTKAKTSLAQLFKQDPNQALFRANLPPAELDLLKAYQEKGVPIKFLPERLHLDDTIETIKKKYYCT